MSGQHFLISILPGDVDESLRGVDISAYGLRKASRGIVMDAKWRVALIYVARHNYYTLPGGGIDDDNYKSALKREIKEELGFSVRIGKLVGRVETYMPRWSQRQVDQAYLAYITGKSVASQPTAFEQNEGHRVIWLPSLDAAIACLESSKPQNLDGRLIKVRELTLLRHARSLI